MTMDDCLSGALCPRRRFLKTVLAGAAGIAGSPLLALAELAKISPATAPGIPDEHIRDYLLKMRDFNTAHQGDISLASAQRTVLESTVRRLHRLQRTVGHANFCLIGFDESLRTARNYPAVGAFSRDELNFMEMIFYRDARQYGFLGKKSLDRLVARINHSDVVKIRHSGNYLFRGCAEETYRTLKRTLGDKMVLTSGVRGVMKQFLLFLAKTCRSSGNLSLASRQLAPPGYSFHGVGDFDVGQAGFGAANFTHRFVTTPVYYELKELGYLTLRYPRDNLLGVRFEPWHIQVKMTV